MGMSAAAIGRRRVTDRRAGCDGVQAGRASPAAGPRASFIYGELESVTWVEHGSAAAPGVTRAVARELVDDPPLARVLAAEDHDVAAVEGRGAPAAGGFGQRWEARPGAIRRVEAVDPRGRWRAAPRHAYLAA